MASRKNSTSTSAPSPIGTHSSRRAAQEALSAANKDNQETPNPKKRKAQNSQDGRKNKENESSKATSKANKTPSKPPSVSASALSALTPAQQKQFLEYSAILAQQAKQAKEDEMRAIQDKNRQLMAMEDSGSESDMTSKQTPAPPSKCPRKSMLDKDEQELADTFAPPEDNQMDIDQQNNIDDQEDEYLGSDEEQRGHGLQAGSKSEESEEESEVEVVRPQTRALMQVTAKKPSNGLLITDKEPAKARSKSVAPRSSQRKDTSTSSKNNKATTEAKINKPQAADMLSKKKASKITQVDFKDNAVLALANAAKNKRWYIQCHHTEGQGTIPAPFHLSSGTADEVKGKVKYLIEGMHFIYGGLNIQPFGCPLVFDIIQSQWFRNASCSKPDYDAAVRMVKEKSVPVHLILMVASAIEHAVKEFGSGKFIHTNYTEETMKAEYVFYHLANLVFTNKSLL
ncbi:hypothetical protein CPB84DRAFT_1754687 [Gymnopilus junonius]|uniref:DUF6532 domain-containing protein n=1 Tax=Gymnopilus junonius TaxID=109634 RepID=A0A9P5N7N3_GYMJU|nr:hypothetical protein CPB84DRAFT_1754687 [Gymnopilus junonius]